MTVDEARRSISHAALVERAKRWLVVTWRCGIVLTEFSAGTGIVVPDAIGWRDGGRWSVLVECKVTRADFLRDRKKASHEPEFRLGQEQWYLTTSGLLQPDEVPAEWGLAEIRGHFVHRVRHPLATRFPGVMSSACAVSNAEIAFREMPMLYSATRRLGQGLGVDVLARHIEVDEDGN